MVAKTKKVFVEDSSPLDTVSSVPAKKTSDTKIASQNKSSGNKARVRNATLAAIPHSVGLGARAKSNLKNAISKPHTKPASTATVFAKTTTNQNTKTVAKSKPNVTKRNKKVSFVAGASTPHSIRLNVQEKFGSRKIDVPIHNNTRYSATAPVKKIFTKAGNTHVRDEVHSKTPLIRFPSLPLIPSPFRFPLIVPTQETMSRIARMSGVCLVVLGGIFSLVHLQATSFSDIHHMGAVEMTFFESNGVPSGETQNVPMPNELPTAKFSVDGNDELKGDVQVVIAVSNSTGVVLSAYNLDEQRLYSLGTAHKIDESTWKHTWNTIRIPDGTYRLVATIQSPSGTHQVNDVKSFFIHNVEDEIESKDTASTTEATIDTPFLESDSGMVSLTPLDTVVSDTISLAAQAPGATDVRFYAQHEETVTSYYLGSAKFQDTSWKRIWDTRTVPNGTYTITVKASINGTHYSDSIRGIEVNNPTMTSSSTVTDIKNVELLNLTPHATLTFSKQNPIYGYTSIHITTSSGVMWLELYAQNKNSLTPTFLGLAQKISDTEWKYVWQTEGSPNGEYLVYARLRTPYGFTEDSTHRVAVLNETMKSLTKEQEDAIDIIHETEDALVRVLSDSPEATIDPQTEPVVFIEKPDSFIEALEVDEDTTQAFVHTLTEYEHALTALLNSLAEAKRTGNSAVFTQTQQDIEKLKNSTIQNFGEQTHDADIVAKVSQYLSEITFKTQEVTLQNEKIIRERIGDAILKDSDNDSISDYDEVHLYHTNPFSGDTDNDGFIDSIEITRGFNPLSTEAEALVVYESPREKGQVREDLLIVSNVSTLSTESASGTKMALIQGVALPNSFVTLYIFSTPIIVTVKTDSTGNWSYILDKELENGQHDVYIGITDNEGHIVAKSSPFPFVKTAEAYVTEEVRTPEAIVSRAEPSLIGGNSMLLVASIAVVALGLVLILIGFHVSPAMRREEFIVSS